jgi:glyoxalase superfamily protein/ClpA/ClpB-like protein
MQDMRDFRDAKAMAQTLRAALAATGFKITISQSLELIAKMFGVADWNTLAAAIRGQALTPHENAFPTPPTGDLTPILFSRGLELALHQALAYANQRGHEHTTLEHVLLALIDDPDASASMKACKVDLDALKVRLTRYIDNELAIPKTDDPRAPHPTAAFQRVVQRAAIHVKDLRHSTITGADLLLAMFDETESHAVWLLTEQEMTQQAAANFILHGIVRRSFHHARTRPLVVEKVKRRTAARKEGKKPKTLK